MKLSVLVINSYLGNGYNVRLVSDTGRRIYLATKEGHHPAAWMEASDGQISPIEIDVTNKTALVR